MKPTTARRSSVFANNSRAAKTAFLPTLTGDDPAEDGGSGSGAGGGSADRMNRIRKMSTAVSVAKQSKKLVRAASKSLRNLLSGGSNAKAKLNTKPTAAKGKKMWGAAAAKGAGAGAAPADGGGKSSGGAAMSTNPLLARMRGRGGKKGGAGALIDGSMMASRASGSGSGRQVTPRSSASESAVSAAATSMNPLLAAAGRMGPPGGAKGKGAGAASLSTRGRSSSGAGVGKGTLSPRNRRLSSAGAGASTGAGAGAGSKSPGGPDAVGGANPLFAHKNRVREVQRHSPTTRRPSTVSVSVSDSRTRQAVAYTPPPRDEEPLRAVVQQRLAASKQNRLRLEHTKSGRIQVSNPFSK